MEKISKRTLTAVVTYGRRHRCQQWVAGKRLRRYIIQQGNNTSFSAEAYDCPVTGFCEFPEPNVKVPLWTRLEGQQEVGVTYDRSGHCCTSWRVLPGTAFETNAGPTAEWDFRPWFSGATSVASSDYKN